jgi:hypothetical protein
MTANKLRHTNWYGFNHEAVKKRFNVVTYLGDLPLAHGPTVAVYHSSNPDRSKGHKDYVMLTSEYVSGRDKEEFEKICNVTGIYCIGCEEVVYSPNRHGMIYCECKKVAVDGGSDYLRISGNVGDYLVCDINLMTQEITHKKEI